MRFVALKLLSKLPISALYRISDVLAMLAERFYRPDLVMKNLRKSFPERSDAELKLVKTGFYKNLADIAVEIVKMQSMTHDQVTEKVRFVENEAYLQLKEMTTPLVLLTCHLSNWEWLGASIQKNVFQLVPVYKKLKNKQMDSFIFSIRARYGAEPLEMNNMSGMIRKVSGNRAIALLADQAPKKGTKGLLWSQFLNQETAFFQGIRIVPYLTQLPCFFVSFVRLQRGFYQVEFKKIGEPPYAKGDMSIFESYVQELENNIKDHPEQWLWTHKRWKNTRSHTEEIIKFS